MAKNLGVTFTIGAALGPGVGSAFSSLQNRLKQTQAAFRLASNQTRQLAEATAVRQRRDFAAQQAKRQISITGHVDVAMRRELAELNRAYMDAAKAASVYGQSLDQINRRQREAAAAAQSTERQIKRLNQVQNARSAMQAESQNRRNLVGSAVSTAVSAAALAAPLKIGAEFDAAMSRVGAISQATGADFDRLRAQARELGATTVWSAKEAAEGMTFLSMAGFKTNETMAAMPGMLSLASAGAMDLASTADIASNVLSGFGMDASKMTYVADVMAKTFTRSNTSIASIGESMKYCAPAAQAAGQSFQDVAAMIGKLGDAGIQGSMAGTALNAIMMRMASPPKMAMEAMELLDVQMADATGKIRAMPDVLNELAAKMSQMKDIDKVDLARKIFGMENAKSGLILMEQAFRGELQKMSKGLYQKGFADKVAKQQTDNLAGDLKALNSASEEVAICFFDVVNPALRTLTQNIIPIVQATGQWISANPRLTQGLFLLGGAFVALKAAGLVFMLINSYRKTFAAGMTSLRGQAGAAVGSVGASFGRLRAELSRPVSVSFQSATQGASSLKGRLDSLRASASQTIARLRQITPASIAAGAAASASGAAAAAGRAGWNTLRLGIRGVGMAFKTMFGPMSLLMMGLSLGVEQIIEHWDRIQPYFEALWEGVRGIFNAVLGWLQPIIDKISGFIGPVIDKIAKVGEFVGSAWDSIFGNDEEKKRKEREKAEAEEKQKAAALSPGVEAALKTPAQMQQDEQWANQYANAKEDFANRQAAEKVRQKTEPAPRPRTRESRKTSSRQEPARQTQSPASARQTEAARPVAQGTAAPAAPETQIVQPQIQVQLSVTQNGIPDAEFAQGVMNAIKSRQAELEQMISAIVNEQARLAYG